MGRVMNCVWSEAYERDERMREFDLDFVLV